jgi:hypothetical protein
MNDHERFKKHLMNSQKCVWKASKNLSDLGLPVTIEPTFFSDSYDNRLYYQDNGDIRISLRIEVKGINTDFTCQEDFPYSHMFVCAKHSWDFAHPKPFGYVIYNKDQTHFAFVIGITNDHILVYSIEKMINILMETSDYTGADSEMDAIDYLSYNVFDNYVGEKTPIYTYTKESFYDTSK